jgi:geranylgeranylglycerol-phosphate geranylgeranyltransferase
MASIIVRRNQRDVGNETNISFAKSQLVLFQSRKKFAFLYCLATVTGLFCLPGVINAISAGSGLLTIMSQALPLPLSSLLVTAGTYILNDLVDADLDRANGKKRPIPSGMVSKRQAWAFIALTFGIALILTAITLRPISIVIVTLMVTIGIAYSAPMIALMKRFVVKTASIAIFYILCALLGLTSAFNLDLATDNPTLVASVLLTLALMVFISSTLNDMGDVDGDKAAGRRTIPIVIGKDNTIRLAMVLAKSVLVITWAFYGFSVVTGRDASPVTTAMTSVIAAVVLMTLSRMRKGLHDAEFMRKQHKRLFPLQMLLHPSLITGVMMF